MKNLLLFVILNIFCTFVQAQTLGIDSTWTLRIPSIFSTEKLVPRVVDGWENYQIPPIYDFTTTNTIHNSDMNCVIEGESCHNTIESSCYAVRIRGTHITVKSGSKYIEATNCHNIIVNSGSELQLENVSNRIYWHTDRGWRWEKIKPIPVPDCK